MGIQDLDHDLISKNCPGIERGTMSDFLHKFKVNYENRGNLPLHILAQENMHRYKDRKYNFKFNKSIIEYYNQDRI